MIHAQLTKTAVLLPLQSVTTSGTVSATVSCVGFRYAEVILQLGTQTAANVDTTMTLSEGDSSTFVTSADFTMTTAAPDTSSNQIYRWFLDLKKRKKNLKIVYQPVGAARLASAIINLSRAEQPPTTAAGHGVAGQVVV